MKRPHLALTCLLAAGASVAIYWLGFCKTTTIQVDDVTGSGRVVTWHWPMAAQTRLTFVSPLDAVIYTSAGDPHWQTITTISNYGIIHSRGCSRAPKSYQVRYLDTEDLEPISSRLREAMNQHADRATLQKIVETGLSSVFR